MMWRHRVVTDSQLFVDLCARSGSEGSWGPGPLSTLTKITTKQDDIKDFLSKIVLRTCLYPCNPAPPPTNAKTLNTSHIVVLKIPIVSFVLALLEHKKSLQINSLEDSVCDVLFESLNPILRITISS